MIRNRKTLFAVILVILICIVFYILHTKKVESEDEIKVSKSKVVYLTFDADMTPFMKKKLDDKKVSSYYSKDLVNYLESEKIPATIFVAGMFAEVYPDLIREMAKYPNIEIANHSYDHPGFQSPCYKLKIINTDEEKIGQMEKTQRILTELTGIVPKYFRHPGLCHNQQDDLLAKKIGLTVSDSGLTSGDSYYKNPKDIIKKVLSEVQDGSVIIMHLGGPNAPATYDAVKEIVSKLKEGGYTFKVLRWGISA
jgi:peptidoglycan/xylan/chitin deacetylase (PgdA/CDA1 family)